MIILVTDHAINRYVERVVGIPRGVLTLSAPERKRVAEAIRNNVREHVQSGVRSFRLHRPDATYVVEGHTVVTILPPIMKGNGVHA